MILKLSFFPESRGAHAGSICNSHVRRKSSGNCSIFRAYDLVMRAAQEPLICRNGPDPQFLCAGCLVAACASPSSQLINKKESVASGHKRKQWKPEGQRVKCGNELLAQTANTRRVLGHCSFLFLAYLEPWEYCERWDRREDVEEGRDPIGATRKS